MVCAGVSLVHSASNRARERVLRPRRRLARWLVLPTVLVLVRRLVLVLVLALVRRLVLVPRLVPRLVLVLVLVRRLVLVLVRRLVVLELVGQLRLGCRRRRNRRRHPGWQLQT